MPAPLRAERTILCLCVTKPRHCTQVDAAPVPCSLLPFHAQPVPSRLSRSEQRPCRSFQSMPLRRSFNQGLCMPWRSISVPISAPAFLSYASCAYASQGHRSAVPDPCRSIPSMPLRSAADLFCAKPWPILPILCFALADLVAPCYAFAKHLRSIPCRCGACHFYANPSPCTPFPQRIMSVLCLSGAYLVYPVHCQSRSVPIVALPLP